MAPPPSLIRKIPGYRSGNKLKSVVASFFYLFLFLLVIAIIVPTAPTLALDELNPTDQKATDITGRTHFGKPVFLLQNGEVILQVKASSDGKFAFHLENLQEGSHTYTVEACDEDERKHCKSEQITLLVDYTPPQRPELQDAPERVSIPQVALKGKAEPNTKIKIAVSGKEIATQADDLGGFEASVPLIDGNNEVRVISVDGARNESEVLALTIKKYPAAVLGIANINFDRAKVKRVIDGDTIELEGGSRVRYIGINTPEVKEPTECYGKEATDKNKGLVEGKTVLLEKDVSEIDQYNRLLRYVWQGDTLINDYLVREGYAFAVSYPPDVNYQERFRNSEREAREESKGLWGDVCQSSPNPTSQVTTQPSPQPTVPPLIPAPTKTPQQVTSPVAEPILRPPTQTPPPTLLPPPPPTQLSGGCKYPCDGPDRDCPDFATHVEAQAFFNCCGFTATYDPMRLDGWGNKVDDGIACESLP